jgi:hypothetical protein
MSTPLVATEARMPTVGAAGALRTSDWFRPPAHRQETYFCSSVSARTALHGAIMTVI